MHPSQSSTDAAVIRASRVDPAAFVVVFDRHWSRIHRYCVVRAGPPGEDVAAETFRVAFDRRSDYDGRADAAPWLYGIATNLLRTWFRSTARRERAVRRSADLIAGDDVEDALERAEAQRLGPELAAVLARLSPEERDALLMHACAELTYDQIARRLGLRVAAAGVLAAAVGVIALDHGPARPARTGTPHTPRVAVATQHQRPGGHPVLVRLADDITQAPAPPGNAALVFRHHTFPNAASFWAMTCTRTMASTSTAPRWTSCASR
jgi:RNA polymerase sigma-70 factor (ECF subfamily)